MHIGLTYDLRDEYLAAGYGLEETAEFDRADTIDAIEGALQELGYQTDRIGNARQLVRRVSIGGRWDLVFNICEGLHGRARESQVPAILELYEIPYTFADPCTMAICLDKGVAKAVVRDAGLPTPPFLVVERLEDLETGRVPTPYPLFAKPLAEGTGKGVTPHSRVKTQRELQNVCADLLARYKQAVLVEAYLPGREFTVGILGTGDGARCLGTLEILLRNAAEPDAYSYVNRNSAKSWSSTGCDGRTKTSRCGGRRRPHLQPGALWGVAMRAGLICAAMRRDALSFWRPIPWPGSTPGTPTCPCWPRRWG
jgi:D-alanine-D-alanine ligase